MFRSMGLFRAAVSQRRFQQLSSSRFINTTSRLKCLDRDKIKVKLYPEDEDPILVSIFESNSMQQVFDTYNSVNSEYLSPKYSSQALVTLWDLQKLIFRDHGCVQATQKEEYVNLAHYINTLRQNLSFKRIVSHIVRHCSELEDQALAASLLCISYLKFDVRGTNGQPLVNELLKRKSTLDLPGLSRLFVTLRDESLYGYVVMAEFTPLLHSYILNMSTDEDVRLVSTAILVAYFVTTKQALNDYILRVKQIMDQGLVQLQPATLYKILMFLFEKQFVYQAPLGSSSKDAEMTKITAEMLRRTGNMFAPHVESMTKSEIVNFSRFHSSQSALLNYAVAARVSGLIEQSEGNPSADLMACFEPTCVEDSILLGNYLKQSLQDCEKFNEMCRLAYRILKNCLYDSELCGRFWSVQQQVLERGHTMESDFYLSSDDSVLDEDDDIALPNSEYGPLFFLNFVMRYMYFRVHIYRSYRHYGFESIALKLICKLFQDYDDGKRVLTTRNYAKCIAFLLATGHSNVILKPSFIQQFRVPHLLLIYRGWRLSPGNSFDVVAVLGQQTQRLLRNSLTARDYLGLAKVNLPSQQAFEMSPVFQECMNKTAEALWDDARTASDFLSIIMISAYYSRPVFERISRFICEAGNNISLKCATKFSTATYICGTGDFDALSVVAHVIERYAERSHPLALIDAMLGLCHHGYLSKELVHKVFSIRFLDKVDKQIRATPAGTRMAIRLRDAFMQLNRAVCIDMPQATAPWFHEKYCEEIAAVDGFCWTYVHHEVLEVLSDILGAHCVARNTYSPYYHSIDFLIHVDERCNPVSVKSKEEAVRKVAVIVHDYNDYTKGERRLKGVHLMKRRHLEILGYQVIEIDPVDWNSMRLSETGAR